MVEAVGPGLDALSPGDRVSAGSKHCTRFVTEGRSLRPIPAGVSDEEAVFGVLGCTALNGVRQANLAIAESVVVIGAGIVGQLKL